MIQKYINRYYLRRVSSVAKCALKYLSNKPMLTNQVRIDACTMCQLSCLSCPTSHGFIRNGVVGSGYLKFKDFKLFVDANPTIRNIEISNWGEIFLNPQLKQIIEYAYSKGVDLIANNGVNMNQVNDEMLECLVTSKFKSLVISLDGASNDTYTLYRKGGNFDRVIKNIKMVNFWKKKYNSSYPKLSWKFIVFGHNEVEIVKARKMAERLDMDFIVCLPWDQSVSPIRNKDFVMKEIGLGRVSKVEDFRVEAPCEQLWLDPQINWDGKLLGCCANKWGDFGNIFKDGLKECLLSERYKYAKKVVMGKARMREDIACSMCHHYKYEINLTPLTSKQLIRSYLHHLT